MQMHRKIDRFITTEKGTQKGKYNYREMQNAIREIEKSKSRKCRNRDIVKSRNKNIQKQKNRECKNAKQKDCRVSF